MGKPHTPGISSRSGTAPPVETRFGGPRANPGNPGGFPKGFIAASRAYAIIACYELSEVEQIAKGKKPKRWGKRPLRMSYVSAAREWLKGNVEEIADRTEGRVKTVTDLNMAGRLEVHNLADLVRKVGKG